MDWILLGTFLRQNEIETFNTGKNRDFNQCASHHLALACCREWSLEKPPNLFGLDANQYFFDKSSLSRSSSPLPSPSHCSFVSCFSLSHTIFFFLSLHPPLYLYLSLSFSLTLSCLCFEIEKIKIRAFRPRSEYVMKWGMDDPFRGD